MICDECSGKGETDKITIIPNYEEGGDFLKTKMCMKCQGSGTIDWIEKIRGKKQDESDPLYPYVEVLLHDSTIILPTGSNHTSNSFENMKKFQDIWDNRKHDR